MATGHRSFELPPAGRLASQRGHLRAAQPARFHPAFHRCRGAVHGAGPLGFFPACRGRCRARVSTPPPRVCACAAGRTRPTTAAWPRRRAQGALRLQMPLPPPRRRRGGGDPRLGRGRMEAEPHGRRRAPVGAPWPEGPPLPWPPRQRAKGAPRPARVPRRHGAPGAAAYLRRWRGARPPPNGGGRVSRRALWPMHWFRVGAPRTAAASTAAITVPCGWWHGAASPPKSTPATLPRPPPIACSRPGHRRHLSPPSPPTPTPPPPP